MRVSRLVYAAVAAAAITTIAASPVRAQETMKMNISIAQNSHYGVAIDAFAKEIEKRTSGRYIVQNFYSGALGAERESIEGVQLGTLDLTMTSTGPVPNFVPEVAILDIPFLFRDYAHARGTLDGPIGQEMLQKFQSKGLVALAWGENGFRHMTNNKRPVNVPEDLKGLKMRTMENPIHIQAYKQFGILPTPMAFTEVFTALQQGTVDGQDLYAARRSAGIIFKVNVSGVVPLTLTSVNATYQYGHTAVKWETSSEQDLIGFTVQYSDNGHEFKDAGFVAATNNSRGSNYDFIHRLSLSGTRFYRLAIQHGTGSTTFSSIITVRNEKSPAFILNKNVSNNLLSLMLNTKVESLRILNTTGSLLYRESLQNRTGMINLQLPYLSEGVYIVVIGNNAEVYTDKIIISH